MGEGGGRKEGKRKFFGGDEVYFKKYNILLVTENASKVLLPIKKEKMFDSKAVDAIQK